MNINPSFWKELESNNNYIELFDDTTFWIIEYDDLFPNPKTANYHIASKKHFVNSSELIEKNDK